MQIYVDNNLARWAFWVLPACDYTVTSLFHVNENVCLSYSLSRHSFPEWIKVTYHFAWLIIYWIVLCLLVTYLVLHKRGPSKRQVDTRSEFHVAAVTPRLSQWLGQIGSEHIAWRPTSSIPSVDLCTLKIVTFSNVLQHILRCCLLHKKYLK